MIHNAKVIHYTQDGDDLIAHMARVSNPAGQEKASEASGLISYLIKHGHWSPFEMVNMCVEINTTRSIAAQILRHRSFSFQEFSQRYSDVNKLGLPILPELRRQDILLNKTREGIAKDYVTKEELRNDMSILMERMDKIGEKLDKLFEVK